MATPQTVFIVDDDAQTRASLLSMVVDLMHLRGKSYDSADAFLADYDETSRGCALVDLRMPGMSGLDLLQLLAQRKAPLPVVVVSGFGDVSLAVQAMKLGAVDFLQKPYQPADLRQAIERALKLGHTRRQASLSHELDGFYDQLTDDERLVLELTIEGRPNKAIASELGISLRTVHIRRASLMRKLGVRNRAELVLTALRPAAPVALN